jgi:tetratricopeptide (TPR) repeat protein
MVRAKRRVVVVDNTELAEAIGERIRKARLSAGLTQKALASGRYTSAYISALENGRAKPSMAALAFISERLGLPTASFLGRREEDVRWLDADIALASGDMEGARDAYQALLDEPMERAKRARVLRGLAEALCRLGRGGEAIGPASESVELLRTEERAADVAEAEYWLAYAHFLRENLSEARAVLDGIHARLRQGLQVLPDFHFRVLMAIANVDIRRGEHQAALAYMEEARAMSAELDLRRQATLYSGLAVSYREAGDLEASVVAGIKSLALYRSAEAEREEAILSNNLALTYLRLGNLDRAGELLAAARAWAEGTGDTFTLAHVTESDAQLALARGELDGAAQLARRAVEVATAAGNHRAAASAHATAAAVATRRDDFEGAVRELREAVEITRRHGPPARLRDLLAQLAGLHRERGEFAVATELYAEALAVRS